jgi:hypothetical protein
MNKQYKNMAKIINEDKYFSSTELRNNTKEVLETVDSL